MAQMRDFFHEAEEAVFGRHHHHDEPAPGADPYPQAPAQQPVNVAAAPAAAQSQQEDNMSVLTDIEQGWTAAKGELAKFEQALPGALAKAKQFEASPFAAIAEKAAASVLPPEAVAIAVGAAEKVIDDLAALYSAPQPADPAPTGQQPVQAPAQ